MANEKRLIDAFESICKKCDHYLVCKYADNETAECNHYKAFTVDAVEVVHGRWIKRSNGTFDCSVCHIATARSIPVKGVDESTLWNYCPNCGAKMDGGNEDV